MPAAAKVLIEREGDYIKVKERIDDFETDTYSHRLTCHRSQLVLTEADNSVEITAGSKSYSIELPLKNSEVVKIKSSVAQEVVYNQEMLDGMSSTMEVEEYAKEAGRELSKAQSDIVKYIIVLLNQ